MPFGHDEGRTRGPGGDPWAGVIGWPVQGSLSPAIHNAAFAALGLSWRYLPVPVPPDRLREALAEMTVDPWFRGANVTMPHKEEVAGLVSSLSPDAGLVAAVNTIAVGQAGLAGHNTDAPGFARFLAEDAGFDPAGRWALLLGAGGAARACALALARGGLARLTVAARDPSRTGALRRAVSEMPVEVRVVPWEDEPEAGPDLIVNATPVAGPGALPLPRVGPSHVVVDLGYRPPVTPLVAAARRAGAAAFTGLGMLVHQAALSFELWTGRIPPDGVMPAAALAALAARES